ncbi:uncharacterized protein SCHCODRAFT_02594195 [Schizophyllum commune H4-8]|nr:uncharacterized protein SCHCODRAFT_02594195 [Schizophyllum commune H4-8]KAI5885041.1 hypothetical protein SCHCODRAFT_02594195 [Schizophyllum commune H4-8]
MASSNDPSSQIPDVRASLGPLLIASTISWAFWGLLTMQVIRYYLSYKRDTTITKTLVAIVWYERARFAIITSAIITHTRFLDSAHAVILYRGVYQCLINDFGRMIALEFSRVFGEFPPRAIVTILVQGFCYWRIWKLHRSFIPLALFVIMALAQIAFMILYMVTTFGTFPASRKSSLLKCASYGYLAAVLITDLTMAGLLSALLYKQRKDTPYQRTSEMLRRLFYYSINTGTWTAVFALVAILTVSFQPKTAWWAAIFDVGVCGVYSNTLLVNLNGRDFAAGEPEVSHSPVSAQSTKHGPLRDSKRGPLRDSKRGPSTESTATEAILPFEAAKRSQISDVE